MDVSAQPHVPASLPRAKGPRYPLDMRLDGTRARLDAVAKERESMLLPEIEPR
jgi:hypothetical protein